jgi:hypothetical protein
VTVHTDAFKGLTDRCFLWISEMIDLLQADIADQKPRGTATEVQISRLLRRSVKSLDEIDKRGGELHRGVFRATRHTAERDGRRVQLGAGSRRRPAAVDGTGALTGFLPGEESMDEEELSAALKETIDRHFAEVRRIFAECARDVDRRFYEVEAHLKKMDGHLDNMEEHVAVMQESLK